MAQPLAFATPAQPPFGEADIRRCLPGEIEKGRGYFLRGAVRGLRAEADGSRLVADVQGTRAKPYQVEIAIESSRKGVRLVGRCSCPVGWNCKHCAAALLQAIEEPPGGLTTGDPDPLDGPIAAWLAQLPPAGIEEAETVEMLVYRLDRQRNAGRSLTLEARIVRPLKSGRLGAGRSCSLADLHTSRARYVGPDDRLICRLTRNSYWSTAALPDDPETMALLMQHLVTTGRCYWRDIGGTPLSLGPRRRGAFVWRLDNSGNQAVEAQLAEGEGEILPCAAPWYVDPGQSLAGPVDFGVKPEIAAAFLAAPPVAPNQAPALAEALARRFPGLGLPAPRTELVEEIRRDPPLPVLRLATRKRAYRYAFGAGRGDDRIDIAFLGYEYDGKIIDARSAPPELRSCRGRARHRAAAPLCGGERLSSAADGKRTVADGRLREGEGRGQAARVQLRSTTRRRGPLLFTTPCRRWSGMAGASKSTRISGRASSMAAAIGMRR